MKRRNSLGALIMLATVTVPVHTLSAQCWHDDFESYATGPILNQGAWEQWGQGSPPLDAQVMPDPFGAGQGQVLSVQGDQDAVVRFDNPEATGMLISTGRHRFRTLLYNSSEFDDVAYFIMLNQYNEHVGGGDTNWAVQTQMDRGAGLLIDDGECGAAIPLPLDQWTEFVLIIDLDANTQEFYVDGRLFYAGDWAGHVSTDPGVRGLAALDYWGNNAEDPVFYDESSVNWSPKLGACLDETACCLADGTCLPDLSGATCSAQVLYVAFTPAVACADVDCGCPADLGGDGAIGSDDLIALLAAWGTSDADINGDGVTDVGDLFLVLAGWGPCG